MAAVAMWQHEWHSIGSMIREATNTNKYSSSFVENFSSPSSSIAASASLLFLLRRWRKGLEDVVSASDSSHSGVWHKN